MSRAFNWQGCYIGGIAGYSWGSSRQTYGGHRAGVVDPFLPVGFDITGDYDLTGANAGGEIGCNLQFSANWVVGVELDASWTDLRGQAYPGPGAVAAGSNPLRTFYTEQTWLTTARARLGYAMDQWLFYVTGGFAHTNFSVNNHAGAVAANGYRHPENVERSGWIAGLGIEYAATSNWSIKTEVLYADFGGSFFYMDAPAQGCVQCYSMNVDVKDIWMWRIGLNYRFYGG
jgi:outer membrane immunogenic protein